MTRHHHSNSPSTPDALARKLAEVEDRYRALVQATGHMTWTAAADGHMTDTGAWRTYTGQSAEETRDWGAFGAVHPDDRAWAQREWLQAVASVTPFEIEFRVRRFDGVYRSFLARGVPVCNPDGTVREWIGFCADITARTLVETEERRLQRRTHDALDALLAMARALVGAEPATPIVREDTPMAPSVVGQRLVELTRDVLGCRRVGIEALDQRTRVTRPLAVVGLPPEQEPSWWALERPPLDEADQALAARLYAGEVIVIDMREPPYRDLPNEYGISTMLVAPMRVADRLMGLLSLDYGGVPHDFTAEDVALAGAVATLTALVLERERLLQEREEARSNALAFSAANRRMDEFLRLASHELRSPLTGIKGSIQLAQRRLASVAAAPHGASGLQEKLEAIRALLGRTDMQVDRMNRLVSDLLDVSRIDTGHLDIHLGPADLSTIVREVVVAHRQLYPTRTIALELPSESVPVSVDSDRVAQVVTNYLTNALKYSEPGRPVRVSVGRDEAEAWVRVRDEGPGLTPEQQAGVWDRYRRVPGVEVRDPSTGSGGGLGLGLHISRTLIERQSGRVGVESAPGAGSTFFFAVPLAE